ncbi:MAG: hypothetical protein ACRDRQ_10270 [Pseudonocardiaceae bacterium]
MATQQAKCITALSRVVLAETRRDADRAWCWRPPVGADQGSRP